MNYIEHLKTNTNNLFTPTIDINTFCRETCDSREKIKRHLIFFPGQKRQDISILYTFARILDDVVDNTTDKRIKKHAVSQAQTTLEQTYSPTPSGDVNSFAYQMHGIVRKYRIPQKLFQMLLNGMKTDVLADDKPMTFQELNKYIDQVSVVPGFVFSAVLEEDPKTVETFVPSLFTAVQYADILLDLKKDTQYERLYLPKELLEKHGITEARASTILSAPQLPAVLQDMANLALYYNIQAQNQMNKITLKHPDFYEYLAKLTQIALLKHFQQRHVTSQTLPRSAFPYAKSMQLTRNGQ